MYCGMHVYEKLDGMSAWLLGFITLRELLLDERPSTPATYVRDLRPALELGLHVGHGWQPLWREEGLEPKAGKGFQAVPQLVAVRGLWHPATRTEGDRELVKHPGHCRQLLVNAAKEDRAALLGERWGILGRERKATGGGLILQITSAGHPAQPLPC